MTIRVVAAALGATLLAASPARAQTTTGGLYLTGRLGAFSPGSDLHGFGVGFDGELGLGYRFMRNLGVEGAVGYYRTDERTMWDPVVGASVPGDGLLSVVPVTATLRAILPLGRVEVSALAGLGVYIAHLDAGEWVRASPSPEAGRVRVPVSSTDSRLGFHSGAGVAVYVTPRLLLGTDLRYVVARAKLFDTTTHIGGLRLDAVLGYRF